MKKVNYGTFTNPPSLSFANYCDGLDAKRQGDTSRAIYVGLHFYSKLRRVEIFLHVFFQNCSRKKLLTKALHFIDEEKLESCCAENKKDKIYLQRAACFFIESDYQAAHNDVSESLKLKLSTKVGIY